VLGVLDLGQHLDAPVEVARHQVGRPDEVERLVVDVAVAEAVDPAVLEVAPEDAADADVLGQPGTPARRHEMPRTIMSICTPAWLASYSASIMSGVADRVHLQRDPALGAEAGLALDQRPQPRPQLAWATNRLWYWSPRL
jgi:hypothetical protein